ncbi:MAG: hypothetical protein AVDCRST_MAG70-1086 [uncultured Thermomicrobiales bacterium]|uniref:Uncharacterized protein n=1 Tax=uncultured Thermomicrobiales bacterium TaxID=1645740 RepID=A0A6J4UNF1_9BACT|nr:MAG: hypothetical protein AVDCRST_MAG70-1086 [uncultured Thermomicrobiales bacterium]
MLNRHCGAVDHATRSTGKSAPTMTSAPTATGDAASQNGPYSPLKDAPMSATAASEVRSPERLDVIQIALSKLNPHRERDARHGTIPLAVGPTSVMASHAPLPARAAPCWPGVIGV